MNKKLLLIGLDGADFKFINNNLSQLPTINSLVERGIFTRLKSTIPPLTTSAWSTAMSGMNAGKTGVMEFLDEDVNGEREPASSRSIKVPRIWDVLGSHDIKVGVIGVPLTYPVEPVNGFMISGFPAPENPKNWVYPQEISTEINDNYKINLAHSRYKDSDLFLKDIYANTHIKFETAINFLKKMYCESLIFVISETDWIQHFFSRHPEDTGYNKNKEIILDYFKFIDKNLKELLSIEKNINIIVISDHGFGKKIKKNVYINTLLYTNGLFSSKDSQSTKIKRLLGYNLRNLASLWPLKYIKNKLPRQIKGEILKTTYLTTADMDMENTKAWYSNFEYNTGYVRINREVVGEGEYEKLREEIISMLINLKDNGENVIKEVYKKEEIFTGTNIKAIPDILIVFNSDYTGQEILGGEVIKEIPEKVRPGIAHTMEGIFIASGPDFIENSKLDGLNIIDIAPTVYHLMGIPLPNETDGRVITEIFNPDSKPANKPIKYKKYPKEKSSFKWNESEKKEVMNRLRELGYVD